MAVTNREWKIGTCQFQSLHERQVCAVISVASPNEDIAISSSLLLRVGHSAHVSIILWHPCYSEHPSLSPSSYPVKREKKNKTYKTTEDSASLKLPAMSSTKTVSIFRVPKHGCYTRDAVKWRSEAELVLWLRILNQKLNILKMRKKKAVFFAFQQPKIAARRQTEGEQSHIEIRLKWSL